MRAALLLAVTLVVLPLAAAEPDVRPFCDGKPLVDLESCADGFTVRTCGNDPSHGLTCFGLTLP